jgi:integrase
MTHNTFKPIAEEWHKKESDRWSKSHAERVWQTLEADVLAHLGNMPIRDIRAADVLRVIKKIE